jgi:iron complex outermembrane receptor protein
VTGSYLHQRHTERENGAPVDDARHQSQLSLRRDWQGGADRISVHGNVFRGAMDQPEPGAVSNGSKLDLGTIASSGANLTGRWQRTLEGGVSVMLQGYLERTKRDVPPTFAETLDIADLQFQHALARRGAHEIVWGANYRRTWDDVTNSPIFAFLPAQVTQNWASLFAQDEIALRPDLRLTAGLRLERNAYTGTEVLPTLRLAWQAAPQHALWAGLSRTVRAPSRLDADAYLPGVPPYLLRGGPMVRSEVAQVLEAGYRGQPTARLSYSVTAFFNRYDHLRTQEFDARETIVTFANLMTGRARGIEMWGNFQAAPSWRLSAGVTGLHQRFTLMPGSTDTQSPATSGRDPSHTAQLRSSLSIGTDKEVDVVARKVGALREHAVPGYCALDARVGWRVNRRLELSLSGINLNGAHAEYGPLATRTAVPRQIAFKLIWRQ